MSEVLIGLGAFAGGFVLGWIARGLYRKGTDPTKTMCAILIVLVWAASVLVDMVSEVYATPLAVHALVGAVCGWLFGFDPMKVVKRNGKDESSKK